MSLAFFRTIRFGSLFFSLGVFVLISVVFVSTAHSQTPRQPLKVGSKKFTESVTLAEIIQLKLIGQGLQVTHLQELGGTRILWNALKAGNIDFYVEYSGTISEELLKQHPNSLEELNSLLAPHGLGALPSLGFNDTYAVGMLESRAEKLGISTISDLRNQSQLKFGFGNEFRLRADGWPGLKKKYRLPHREIRGLDHDIAYRALDSGDIDLTDLYTTDAEIDYYKIRVLKDDLGYFPVYDALILYRLDLKSRAPESIRLLNELSGSITNEEMIEMNRLVKIDNKTSKAVAVEFLSQKFSMDVEDTSLSRTDRLLLRTKEHAYLVLVSLLTALIIGIPLGIAASKLPTFGTFILGTVGLIQTIPALALLVILIRPLNAIGLSGIGDTPALIALVLYSLLPIVRNTHTGLQQIPLSLKETAAVLNLSRRTQLLKVEIPLALPSILSGIKTSAVLNIGFATLGALVGAGGYGQPILTGIRLDDYGLILEGALPAAVLAVLVQGFFEFGDTYLVSPGLRSRRIRSS